MGKLLILLKYQLIWGKYRMFGINLSMKQFQQPKKGKYLSSFLTDDDRSLSASRKFSKHLKKTFHTTNVNICESKSVA